MNVADSARYIVAGGIAAAGVYAVAQWDGRAGWLLAFTVLIGVLIARPALLSAFNTTIAGIFGTGPAGLGKAPTRA